MKTVLDLVTHFKIQEMGKNLTLCSRFLCLSDLPFFQLWWLILMWLATTYHLWRTGTFVSSEHLYYFKSLFCQLDMHVYLLHRFENFGKSTWICWKREECLERNQKFWLPDLWYCYVDCYYILIYWTLFLKMVSPEVR